MPKKMKRWSDLTMSKQASIEKKWNKINQSRRKAGQRSYGVKAKAAWLEAQGIGGKQSGLVIGTQKLKRLKRKYGE